MQKRWRGVLSSVPTSIGCVGVRERVSECTPAAPLPHWSTMNVVVSETVPATALSSGVVRACSWLKQRRTRGVVLFVDASYQVHARALRCSMTLLCTRWHRSSVLDVLDKGVVVIIARALLALNAKGKACGECGCVNCDPVRVRRGKCIVCGHASHGDEVQQWTVSVEKVGCDGTRGCICSQTDSFTRSGYRGTRLMSKLSRCCRRVSVDGCCSRGRTVECMR